MYDLAIIGSGPAGYTAAIYAARSGLNTVLVGGSVEGGGALMNTTEVDNYPGFPQGIMGPVLMDNMRAQVERFNVEILDDDVEHVSLITDVKTLTTSENGVLNARSVILATGSAYRKLGLPLENELSGKGVSWCATCDGFFFRNKKVIVVGGGDSAAEEALFLQGIGVDVTLVHRGKQLRAQHVLAEEVKEKIPVLFETEVVELIEKDQKLGAVKLSNSSTLEVDGLFVAIGSDPRVELFADQVELYDSSHVKTIGKSSHTSVAGVFAAGDVADPTYAQAITSAGSGCIAATDAHRWLSGN